MPRITTDQDAFPSAVIQTAATIGANVAAARLRRRWTQEELAAKAGINRRTLLRLEAGELGTGIGAYISVLWALNLHDDLAQVASRERDPEGATLEAARLGARARAPGRFDDDF